MPILIRSAWLVCLLLPTTVGAQPQANPALVGHVTWSIYHEGCRVYSIPSKQSPLIDHLRPPSELRQCVLRMQRRNPQAIEIIRAASDKDFREAVLLAAKAIPVQYHLKDNFAWVAVHQHQGDAFKRLDIAGLYEGIRAIYAAEQLSNPNARYLLAAARNAEIHTLVVGLTPRSVTHPAALTTGANNSIVINPRKLSGDSLSALQAQLLRVAQGADWEELTVKNPTSVGGLASLFYSNRSEDFGQLKTNIETRNQMDADRVLQKGDRISLPPVPAIPEGAPNSDIVQVFDIAGRKSSPKSIATGNRLPLSDDVLRHSSSWVLTGRKSAISALVASLPESARSEITQAAYQGPTDQVGNLILLGPATCRESKPVVAREFSSTAFLSSTQAAAPAARLYVLDFFDPQTTPPGSCPHGQKVLEVIKQAFEKYGKANLFTTNVVQIELDFFRHAAAQSHFIEDYIRLNGGANQTFLFDVLAALKKKDVSTVGAYETPILYLRAIYDAIARDTNATVVSSAFYTESDGYAILPDSFKPTSTPILVSAVDDNEGDIDSFELEPLKGLYVGRRDFPVLLVGGALTDGSTFGMTSGRGDGVSCLGIGNGWGEGASCIRPQDKGTSFSAPSVAVMVFLARLSWNSGARQMSGTSARDRVLHSVEILPTDPTGYLSPGVPNFAWLADTSRILMVRGDGNASECQSVEGSISYTHPGKRGQFSVPFQPGSDGVSGVQQSGGTSYIFDNAQKRWLPITITALSLTVKLSDGTTQSVTSDDFGHNAIRVIFEF
jgi:hypothetical protein